MGKILEELARERNLVRQVAAWEALLSKFERHFGEDNIRFHVSEYTGKLGIAYVPAELDVDPSAYMRIAYKFPRIATEAHWRVARDHLGEWLKNPKCPPGVIGDNMLEGNELDTELMLKEEDRGA